MKKIYIIILLFLGSLTACNDWLDVTPVYNVEEKFAFTNEDGYNTALRGLYQTAAKSSLYGKELSWGMLSGMAQEYDYLYANSMYYAGIFDYTRTQTKPLIADIWQGLYNVIANANLLIKNVKDADPGLFATDTLDRDRIYGEALGMRAVMHLDVVRLFTPAPTSTGGQEKLVPYHNVFPSEFTIPVTTNETLDLIIADLKKAADLLAPYDTIKVAIRTNQPRDDNRFRQNGARGYHMTYAAVVCYLSRAYMYKGDYQNALYYANHFYTRLSNGRVTSTGAKDGNAQFIFDKGIVGGQSSYKGYKYMGEVAFALYQPDLLDWIDSYYKSNFGLGIFFEGVYSTGEIDMRFGADVDDMRKLQFETREMEDSYSDIYECVYSKRYDAMEHTTYHFERKSIPMMRMSEMYYNMIECHYRLGNETEAIRLLNEWRRGKQMSRVIDAVPSLTDLQDIIINDARREYITEGEVFHICKRMNRPLIENGTGNPIAISDSKVTFPIPESQDL